MINPDNFNFKLAKNFTIGEFVTASTGEIRESQWENLLVYLIPALQDIRDWYEKKLGKPTAIKITSFIRSVERNNQIGGAQGSAHVSVGAVDLVIDTQEKMYTELFAFLQENYPNLRFAVYCGIPGRADVHIDPGYILGTHNMWQQLIKE